MIVIQIGRFPLGSSCLDERFAKGDHGLQCLFFLVLEEPREGESEIGTYVPPALCENDDQIPSDASSLI